MTRDMTFPALSARADSVKVLDSVCDYTDDKTDLREVTAFFEHEYSSSPNGDDYDYKLEAKEIIGVALCDLDEPDAAIEILTRDQAVEKFGAAWVYGLEEVE